MACRLTSNERLKRDSAEVNYYTDAILGYINEVLMKDDLEDVAGKIQDSTLDAAEKSFYEALNYHSSPDQTPPPHEDSVNYISDDTITSYNNATTNSVESGMITENIRPSGNINGDFDFRGNGLTTTCLAKEKFSNPEEDGLVRGRKNVHREEEESDLEEGRNKKHLAASVEQPASVLHEIVDKVLSLYEGENDESNGESGESQPNELAKRPNNETTYLKKGVSKRKAADMRSLLIECMQSVAINDHRNAYKLLRQIRLRASPFGDGTQRLAHYLANSLEARLVGDGNLKYKSLSFRLSDADVLKAYKMFFSLFPFVETSYFFADQEILKLAEEASSIHIIHFGIWYGFQWPPLIQRLSTRPGGPPKIRITGIDSPHAGFRYCAKVKETGCRLANYCQKLNVPFEYNGIKQQWETVSIEDLRIEKGEVLVVNCMFLSMYIVDDTIMEHSSRDALLNLIKRISPDLFIHGIVNGTYNSPFFVSRFREALFYFSSMFDMFEANVPRENQDRMVFEREVLGNEFLNVIACEGAERVVRPETYKQWQSRTLRAGFRQLPLNQEIMKEVKARVKSRYHEDFFLDEANQWMLAGWRGRVMIAFSCWKPT